MYFISSTPKVHRFFSSFLVLTVAACTTAPTRFEIFHLGQWDAKVIIKEASTQKSQLVNLDIVAQRESNLHIEVSSPSGFHLASFAMNDKTMSFLLPREHDFYSGGVSVAGFQKLIGVAIDPHWLVAALFDVPPKGGDWSCENNAKGFIAKCASAQQQIWIEWLDRELARKTILIKTKSQDVQLALSGFQTNVEVKEGLFELVSPPGFKNHRL